MKIFVSSVFVGVLVLALAATTAGAVPFGLSQGQFDDLDWAWCPDPGNDSSPSAGGSFEIYGIGAAFSGGKMYVNVRTNFKPDATPSGGDSYLGSTQFSAGDLYINVDGMFQNRTGTVYGIATTSHGNLVTQAYNTWGGAVTAGNLYSTPVGTLHRGFGSQGTDGWASGTYEGYELAKTETPSDGNPADGWNDYPTLIRYGTLVAGSGSSYEFTGPNGSSPQWDLWYSVDLDAIGIQEGDYHQLQLFFAMECGNDGAEWKGDIPEPTTMVLLGSGLLALANHRRNRHI